MERGIGRSSSMGRTTKKLPSPAMRPPTVPKVRSTSLGRNKLPVGKDKSTTTKPGGDATNMRSVAPPRTLKPSTASKSAGDASTRSKDSSKSSTVSVKKIVVGSSAASRRSTKLPLNVIYQNGDKEEMVEVAVPLNSTLSSFAKDIGKVLGGRSVTALRLPTGAGGDLKMTHYVSMHFKQPNQIVVAAVAESGEDVSDGVQSATKKKAGGNTGKTIKKEDKSDGGEGTAAVGKYSQANDDVEDGGDGWGGQVGSLAQTHENKKKKANAPGTTFEVDDASNLLHVAADGSGGGVGDDDDDYGGLDLSEGLDTFEEEDDTHRERLQDQANNESLSGLSPSSSSSSSASSSLGWLPRRQEGTQETEGGGTESAAALATTAAAGRRLLSYFGMSKGKAGPKEESSSESGGGCGSVNESVHPTATIDTPLPASEEFQAVPQALPLPPPHSASSGNGAPIVAAAATSAGAGSGDGSEQASRIEKGGASNHPQQPKQGERTRGGLGLIAEKKARLREEAERRELVRVGASEATQRQKEELEERQRQRLWQQRPDDGDDGDAANGGGAANDGGANGGGNGGDQETGGGVLDGGGCVSAEKQDQGSLTFAAETNKRSGSNEDDDNTLNAHGVGYSSSCAGDQGSSSSPGSGSLVAEANFSAWWQSVPLDKQFEEVRSAMCAELVGSKAGAVAAEARVGVANRHADEARADSAVLAKKLVLLSSSPASSSSSASSSTTTTMTGVVLDAVKLAEKAASLAVKDRAAAEAKAALFEKLLEDEVALCAEKGGALSFASLAASKVPLLEGKLEATEEALRGFKVSLREAELRAARFQADAAAATDLAATLSSKGEELQTYLAECSKVMGAAAESEEALDALEVIRRASSQASEEGMRTLTSALEQAADASRAALEAELLAAQAEDERADMGRRWSLAEATASASATKAAALLEEKEQAVRALGRGSALLASCGRERDELAVERRQLSREVSVLRARVEQDLSQSHKWREELDEVERERWRREAMAAANQATTEELEREVDSSHRTIVDLQLQVQGLEKELEATLKSRKRLLLVRRNYSAASVAASSSVVGATQQPPPRHQQQQQQGPGYHMVESDKIATTVGVDNGATDGVNNKDSGDRSGVVTERRPKEEAVPAAAMVEAGTAEAIKDAEEESSSSSSSWEELVQLLTPHKFNDAKTLGVLQRLGLTSKEDVACVVKEDGNTGQAAAGGVDRVESALRVGGLSKVKATKIVSLCVKAVVEEEEERRYKEDSFNINLNKKGAKKKAAPADAPTGIKDETKTTPVPAATAAAAAGGGGAAAGGGAAVEVTGLPALSASTSPAAVAAPAVLVGVASSPLVTSSLRVARNSIDARLSAIESMQKRLRGEEVVKPLPSSFSSSSSSSTAAAAETVVLTDLKGEVVSYKQQTHVSQASLMSASSSSSLPPSSAVTATAASGGDQGLLFALDLVYEYEYVGEDPEFEAAKGKLSASGRLAGSEVEMKSLREELGQQKEATEEAQKMIEEVRMKLKKAQRDEAGAKQEAKLLASQIQQIAKGKVAELSKQLSELHGSEQKMQTMAMDLIEKVKEMEGKLEEARETDAAKQRRIDGIDDEVKTLMDAEQKQHTKRVAAEAKEKKAAVKSAQMQAQLAKQETKHEALQAGVLHLEALRLSDVNSLEKATHECRRLAEATRAMELSLAESEAGKDRIEQLLRNLHLDHDQLSRRLGLAALEAKDALRWREDAVNEARRARLGLSKTKQTTLEASEIATNERDAAALARRGERAAEGKALGLRHDLSKALEELASTKKKLHRADVVVQELAKMHDEFKKIRVVNSLEDLLVMVHENAARTLEHDDRRQREKQRDLQQLSSSFDQEQRQGGGGGDGEGESHFGENEIQQPLQAAAQAAPPSLLLPPVLVSADLAALMVVVREQLHEARVDAQSERAMRKVSESKRISDLIADSYVKKPATATTIITRRHNDGDVDDGGNGGGGSDGGGYASNGSYSGGVNDYAKDDEEGGQPCNTDGWVYDDVGGDGGRRDAYDDDEGFDQGEETRPQQGCDGGGGGGGGGDEGEGGPVSAPQPPQKQRAYLTSVRARLREVEWQRKQRVVRGRQAARAGVAAMALPTGGGGGLVAAGSEIEVVDNALLSGGDVATDSEACVNVSDDGWQHQQQQQQQQQQLDRELDIDGSFASGQQQQPFEEELEQQHQPRQGRSEQLRQQAALNAALGIDAVGGGSSGDGGGLLSERGFSRHETWESSGGGDKESDGGGWYGAEEDEWSDGGEYKDGAVAGRGGYGGAFGGRYDHNSSIHVPAPSTTHNPKKMMTSSFFGSLASKVARADASANI